MSEFRRGAEQPSRPDESGEPGALQAQLDSLRSEGAGCFDPVRFRYLEAMARRLPGQPEPVRRLLHDKLQPALADYAERFTRAGGETAEKAPPPATASPLAQLNQHIRRAAGASLAAAATGAMQAHDEGELASVRRFRQAWTRSRTQARVEQAVTRKPAKPGPLNSHALMLDSLALMQALSPDYLRRFLAHVESLQWLDQAKEKYPQQQGTPQAKGTRAKRSRSRK